MKVSTKKQASKEPVKEIQQQQKLRKLGENTAKERKEETMKEKEKKVKYLEYW